jgi:hypothetical protein
VNVGRALWWARQPLFGLLVRGLWWGALVLLLRTALDVLDTSQPIDVDGARAWFAVGVAGCAAVTALADCRRLRWAGIALGTAHGAAYVLLQTLAAP